MIHGPAKRKYMKSSSHPVKVGETWSIDSEMGGSFTVEYRGGDSWKIITKEFEDDIVIKRADWPDRLFILVSA